MQSQPPSDADPISRIQARARHIATLATWHERATDSAAALYQQLLQTQADLARAHELLDIQRRVFGIDLTNPPPPQLIATWRAGSPGYVPVTVDIDDTAVTLIVHGPSRDPDLVREAYDWHQIQQVWREVHREIQGAA